MYRLTMTSAACDWLGWADTGAVLGRMRELSDEHGLTGVALHDGSRFLFVIEGSAAGTTAAFNHVRADARLRDVALEGSAAIGERVFVGWDAACQEVSTVQDARALAETIRRLTLRVRDEGVLRSLSRFVQPEHDATCRLRHYMSRRDVRHIAIA